MADASSRLRFRELLLAGSAELMARGAARLARAGGGGDAAATTGCWALGAVAGAEEDKVDACFNCDVRLVGAGFGDGGDAEGRWWERVGAPPSRRPCSASTP